MALKKEQLSLKKWSDQKWRTSSGEPSEGKKRYLPDKAWDALSPQEKTATNKAKSEGNKEGKQFVSQPEKIAKKTAKYRKLKEEQNFEDKKILIAFGAESRSDIINIIEAAQALTSSENMREMSLIDSEKFLFGSSLGLLDDEILDKLIKRVERTVASSEAGLRRDTSTRRKKIGFLKFIAISSSASKKDQIARKLSKLVDDIEKSIESGEDKQEIMDNWAGQRLVSIVVEMIDAGSKALNSSGSNKEIMKEELVLRIRHLAKDGDPEIQEIDADNQDLFSFRKYEKAEEVIPALVEETGAAAGGATAAPSAPASGGESSAPSGDSGQAPSTDAPSDGGSAETPETPNQKTDTKENQVKGFRTRYYHIPGFRTGFVSPLPFLKFSKKKKKKKKDEEDKNVNETYILNEAKASDIKGTGRVSQLAREFLEKYPTKFTFRANKHVEVLEKYLGKRVEDVVKVVIGGHFMYTYNGVQWTGTAAVAFTEDKIFVAQKGLLFGMENVKTINRDKIDDVQISRGAIYGMFSIHARSEFLAIGVIHKAALEDLQEFLEKYADAKIKVKQSQEPDQLSKQVVNESFAEAVFNLSEDFFAVEVEHPDGETESDTIEADDAEEAIDMAIEMFEVDAENIVHLQKLEESDLNEKLTRPHKGEEKQEFISRFMTDELAKKEFKDNKQRVAVAYNQWERGRLRESLSEAELSKADLSYTKRILDSKKSSVIQNINKLPESDQILFELESNDYEHLSDSIDIYTLVGDKDEKKRSIFQRRSPQTLQRILPQTKIFAGDAPLSTEEDYKKLDSLISSWFKECWSKSNKSGGKYVLKWHDLNVLESLTEAKERHPLLVKHGVDGFNEPKRTPGHKTKSHLVVAKKGDEIRVIRFGAQGAKGSPAKEDESEKWRKRRQNWVKRHKAQNPNAFRDKLSALYWANKVKW